MRRILLCALTAGLLLASGASVEAQSYTARTLGFEGDCSGVPFDPGSFSFLGYRDISPSLYAPCGVQSIITTASAGGSPQVHIPQFNFIDPVDGIDGMTVLAGGTAAFLATGPLEFVFSPPVNVVSLRVLDQAQANRLTIRALDAQGNLLDSQTPARSADEISSYTFTTPTLPLPIRPIVRLQVDYQPTAFDPWYVDRLFFNAWHCGDGEVEPGEGCDDANTRQCDSCDNSCRASITGCLSGTTCIANSATAPGSFGCAVCNTALPVPPGGDLVPAPRTAGTSCDDGLFCSENESCDGSGACVGTAVNCNDNASCTTDSCNETRDACDHTLTTGGCVIGASCVNPGTVNALNPCEVCNPALSTTAYSPASAGTSCLSPSCSAGQLTGASLCDGAGVCTPGSTAACPGGSQCRDSFSCIGPCATDNQCPVGSYCNAGDCTPKGDPGDSCGRDGECTSNVCVDGVCCNKDCDGTCESCNLPGSVGRCSPYIRGTDPEAECGVSQFCSGARSCIIDTQPPGSSCTADEFCASGNCVDGVCCSSKCDGTCEACNLDATLGTCAPYTAGTDPESECGTSRFCSGQRTCVIDTRPNGENCSSDATCVSGHCVDGVCCDKACDRTCESCRLAGSVGECSPLAVGTNPDNDCRDAQVCAAPGVCVGEDRPDGTACTADAVCKSGHCADGVCCDSPCDGICVSCAAAGTEGVCTAFAAGTDPADECSGEAVCDGISRCVSFETRGNGFCTVAAPQPRSIPTYLIVGLIGLAGLVLRRKKRS